MFRQNLLVFLLVFDIFDLKKDSLRDEDNLFDFYSVNRKKDFRDFSLWKLEKQGESVHLGELQLNREKNRDLNGKKSGFKIPRPRGRPLAPPTGR